MKLRLIPQINTSGKPGNQLSDDSSHKEHEVNSSTNSRISPFSEMICSLMIFTGMFLTLTAFCQANTGKDQTWVKTTTNNLTIDWIPGISITEPSAEIRISNAKTSSVLWQGTLRGQRKYTGIRYTLDNLKPELWATTSPRLYDLYITFKDKNQTIKTDFYRIGFRNFETRNGQLYLNGNPIFLRGIAINPPGRGIPDEIETGRKFAMEYVSYMKSLNVNIIRIPDNQIWYDVCDELGMMVFGGNYSGVVAGDNPPADYDKGVQWYQNVKFAPFIHHPSLMIYALTNEVPFRGKAAEEWNKFLTYAHGKLKEWDPTRLYIGNAGYGYGKGGDINDIHRYWGWYYSTAYTFLHVRDYDSLTFPKSIQPLTFTECVGNYTGPDGRYNLTPNHKNPVSQQNWTGHAADEDQANLADQHQIHTFKTVTELIRRLRRINPESSGVFPFTIMFRNWHTIEGFSDMSPKPVTAQARLSYQPVLISWENWQNQVYAGTTLRPIAHIINDADDFSDLINCSLVVRLLDKASSVRYTRTIKLPDLQYYAIHSQKLEVELPFDLFTGYYSLEGIVYSGKNEVSRNTAPLFIARKGFDGTPSKKEIQVYDLSGTTYNALTKNGFNTVDLDGFKKLKPASVLLIGENSADAIVEESAPLINSFVKKGGHLIILRQDESYREYAKSIVPVQVSFPSMDIDNPCYPPPPRPSKNAFNINPERPDHPLFSGINREMLRIWSDYTGWDETRKGYPSIYPVTNGFILKNKTDIETVAVLGNYSVGLEGIALAEIFSGKGSVMLTGFDLCNRIGIDPVAGRLISNMIRYMSEAVPHENHILVNAPIIWGKYETERGILTGINSGFMLNSKPALTGSYEGLPIILLKDGHMFAGKGGGWNNAAGKQYVPYGRRIFGPYVHRDFGGIPLPAGDSTSTGVARFWCRIPSGTETMSTTVWNPSTETVIITILINDKEVSVEAIEPGKYFTVNSRVEKLLTDIKVTLMGDRRLVVLETDFN